VRAADGVDGRLGPPCVGACGVEDFDARRGRAVEGRIDEVEGVGLRELVAEGD